MATKDWNGFKKSGDTYIPNDATARERLQNKVDKVEGKGLSTNDYTNAEKAVVTTAQNNIKANTKLIKDTVGWSGKNLLPNFASSTGIFTVNADKTVLANGQTSNATLKLTDRMLMNFTLPAGSYILTGCPSGGSLQTYFMNCGRNATTGDPSSSWVAIGNDIGEGVAFTLNSPANVQVSVEIRTNVTNKIFAPMIRKANILDDTYEPYHENVVNTLREAEVIEGKNKCDASNAINATNFISAVDKDGTLHFNDVSTIAWSSKYLAKIELKADEEYIISSSINLVYGRIGMNISPTVVLSSSNMPDITIHTSGVGYAEILGKYVNNVSFKSNANQTVYLWFCNDSHNASHAAFNLKIMVRSASETDPTYEPYYIPLKDSMFRREEQAVLGSKNILNNQNAISKGLNGLTFTVNDDKSVTVSGTATNDTSFSLFSFANNVKIPEGDYILSDEAGYYNSNNDAAYLTLARKKDEGTTNYDITTGRQSHSKTFFVKYSNYNRFSCYVFVLKNTVLNNLTFKPMLRLASDPDDTYVPYAMTNKELTDKHTIKTWTNDNLAALITDTDATDMSASFVQKMGNLVVGRVQFKYAGTTTNTTKTIMTLPDELKPAINYTNKCYDMGNNSTTEGHDFYVDTAGQLQINLRGSHDASRWVCCNFTYISK